MPSRVIASLALASGQSRANLNRRLEYQLEVLYFVSHLEESPLLDMLRRCLVQRPHRLLARRGKHSTALSDALRQGAPIDVHPEIQEALENQQPVVALETTIVTHGMPYPANLETARSVENIVRKNQAIPATIGIIEGRVKIGLHPHELERLADVKNNPSVVKVSRRDLGPVISLKRDGGTTCSTTLIFAALAGIKVCGILPLLSPLAITYSIVDFKIFATGGCEYSSQFLK